MSSFDLTRRAWIRRANAAWAEREMTAAWDPERRTMIIVGDPRAQVSQGRAERWDTTVSPWVDRGLPLSGPDAEALKRAWGPGLIFDPVGKRFLAWIGGKDVLSIDRETWAVTRLPMGGEDPGTPYPQGTFGRFGYVPRLHALVVVNSIDKPVYYLQLPSAADRVSVRPPGEPHEEPTPILAAAPAPTPEPGPAPSPVPVPAAVPSTGLAIPERTWVFLPLCPRGGASDRSNPTPAKCVGSDGDVKHITGAIHPETGRIYYVGGDYFGRSYRQEVWSLDLLERFGAADPAAGWRLEYPYCGPPGTRQPQGTDFVGWTWDTKRKVFWLVPGEMQPTYTDTWGQLCTPGGPGADPAVPKFALWQFDPAKPLAERWRLVSTKVGNRKETWFANYDTVSDRIVRVGYNGKAQEYVIAEDRWEEWVDRTFPWLNRLQLVHKGHQAWDQAERRLFVVSYHDGRMAAVRFAERRIVDLGPIPGGRITGETYNSDKAYVAWDPNNKVLLFVRFNGSGKFGGFYAYRPSEQRWEDLSALPVQGTTAPPVPGKVSLTFHPQLNVLVAFGARGGLWLMRYGP
jgi:hypothetical protein